MLFLENSLTDHYHGSIVCVSSVPHEVIHLIQNKDKKESNLGMEGVMKDKVLLQYEWKRLWPMAAIGAALVFFLLAGMARDLTEATSSSVGAFLESDYNSILNIQYSDLGNGATTTFIRELVSEMNIPVVNILVIAFTLYLFGDWHRKKTVEFWCTMPVVWGQRVLVKCMVGAGVLSGLWLAFAAGVLWLRKVFILKLQMNILLLPGYEKYIANDCLANVILSLVSGWLITMTVYAVCCMFQCVMNKGMLSALFALMATSIPMATDLFIRNFSSGSGWQNNLEFSDLWYNLSTILWGGSFNQTTDEGYVIQAENGYGQVWICFASLLLLTAACYLVIWFNRQRDVARKMPLLRSTPVRWVVSFGWGIVAAVGVSFMMIQSVYMVTDGLTDNSNSVDWLFRFVVIPLGTAAGTYFMNRGFKVKVREGR